MITDTTYAKDPNTGEDLIPTRSCIITYDVVDGGNDKGSGTEGSEGTKTASWGPVTNACVAPGCSFDIETIKKDIGESVYNELAMEFTNSWVDCEDDETCNNKTNTIGLKTTENDEGVIKINANNYVKLGSCNTNYVNTVNVIEKATLKCNNSGKCGVIGEKSPLFIMLDCGLVGGKAAYVLNHLYSHGNSGYTDNSFVTQQTTNMYQ